MAQIGVTRVSLLPASGKMIVVFEQALRRCSLAATGALVRSLRVR